MLAPHIAAWALNKRKSKDDSERHVAATAVTTPLSDKPKKRAKKERVLETKGGGTYIPPQPTPQEQAAARDWEAQKEFEREERRAAAERERLAAEKAASDLAWTGSKNAAYNAALQGGTQRLRSLGIESGDPYGVYDQFTGRINQANAGLQVGSDYSTAFAPTILDEILGGARTGQRNKYRTAFNAAVSPYYAEDRFGSTSDDAILASILEDQYGTASSDLTAARDRGQISDIAYNRAAKDLLTARSTANTELQNIGGGVLSGYQDAINQRRQSALDRAAEWDFGSIYDPNQEAGRIRSYADTRGAGLEGDIRGAIGGREFFDINSIIGKAAAKVGNQTTGTTPGTGALLDTFTNQQQQNNATRANEGIF
jgi:hypothetical protein